MPKIRGYWAMMWGALLLSGLWSGSAVASHKPLAHAEDRLAEAIRNPEFMLQHWIDLPVADTETGQSAQKLSLRDAILLALRYNPNIQSAELDRIIQRYQLRLAENAFELQYALAGSANFNQDHFQGVGRQQSKSALATPELRLNGSLGTRLSLTMDNQVDTYDNYHPMLNFSLTQPLLRGFGREVNLASLADSRDNEQYNQLALHQSVADQITNVINAYYSLVQSLNTYHIQQKQLAEAQKTYADNRKKIKAGQLESSANIQQSYQIESLSLAVEQAQNDYHNAQQNLLQSIGLDPQSRIRIEQQLTERPMTIPNLPDAIAIGLKNNLQYQAQLLALRADRRALLVAQNEQRWQLDVSANIHSGLTTDVTTNMSGLRGIYNGRNISQSARINLTIPLNDVAQKNKLISAKVRLEKNRIQLLASKRALMTNITNHVHTIHSLAKRYQLAQKQVKLAIQSYELEKKKQQAGIASSLDVNNTQNQLIQAQNGLISAKIAWLNQIAALERLLGTTLARWQIHLRFGDKT
ncbi:MAG: TolC family protein [Legionellaceae bacterium]|nr:TolC family protein [Legionellaceae bacterium]